MLLGRSAGNGHVRTVYAEVALVHTEGLVLREGLGGLLLLLVGGVQVLVYLREEIEEEVLLSSVLSRPGVRTLSLRLYPLPVLQVLERGVLEQLLSDVISSVRRQPEVGVDGLQCGDGADALQRAGLGAAAAEARGVSPHSCVLREVQ